MFETKELVFYLFLGIIINAAGIISGKYHKKLGMSAEVILGIAILAYSFYINGFIDNMLNISMLSMGYFILSTLTRGKEMYQQVKQEVSASRTVEEIEMTKNFKRIFLDYLIILLVYLGAILFLVLGPDSPLKFVIILAIVTTLAEVCKRTISFQRVKIYYQDSAKLLLIVTPTDSRRIPLSDITSIQLETRVDILKLHPLLTMFSTNLDLTTSLGEVLRIETIGETIYVTPRNALALKELIEEHSSNTNARETKVRAVLPFYHWKNIKRLLGKFYFAITVKGISAYTGLILLFLYFKVSPWIMVVCTLLYWLFNLYISDKVLKVAMDAEEIRNEEVRRIAKNVFEKAGIPRVVVYEAETTEYNGFATGMNIGKSMITLTTSTLNLSPKAIEGILAHEAVHVKRHDILIGQLFRILYIGVLGLVIYGISLNRDWLQEHQIIAFLIIWILIMFYQVYQSLYSQWMEVRADHAGAALLSGGSLQLAEGLEELASVQDKAINKTLEYSVASMNQEDEISSLKRDSQLWRFIEFQFMIHPPMYWRVRALRDHTSGWNKGIMKRWFVDRFKESFLK